MHGFAGSSESRLCTPCVGGGQPSGCLGTKCTRGWQGWQGWGMSESMLRRKMQLAGRHVPDSNLAKLGGGALGILACDAGCLDRSSSSWHDNLSLDRCPRRAVAAGSIGDGCESLRCCGLACVGHAAAAEGGSSHTLGVTGEAPWKCTSTTKGGQGDPWLGGRTRNTGAGNCCPFLSGGSAGCSSHSCTARDPNGMATRTKALYSMYEKQSAQHA